MKSVLISIKPQWCQKIMDEQKTIEVRKTRPNIETPFKCYIYCTQGTALFKLVSGLDFGLMEINGKVIGEFVCDKIDTYLYGAITKNEYWIIGRELEQTCMNYDELQEYGNGKTLYGWHISDVKIYDKPKELSEFRYSIKCPQAELNNYDGEWYCNDGYTKNATVNRTEVFPYNEECIYFNCPSVGGESSENEDYAYCTCNGYKPLTRPPQSWRYVEELEEKRAEIKTLKTKNENFVELSLAIGDSVYSPSFIFHDVADDKEITGWSGLEVFETKIETLSQRLRESANLLEGRVFRTREEAQKKLDTILSEPIHIQRRRKILTTERSD